MTRRCMAVAALGGPVGGFLLGLCLWTWRARIAALVQRDVKPYDPAAVRTAWLTRERSGR